MSRQIERTYGEEVTTLIRQRYTEASELQLLRAAVCTILGGSTTAQALNDLQEYCSYVAECEAKAHYSVYGSYESGTPVPDKYNRTAAQLQAQSDRADFIEDCIAEMAMIIYA